MLGGTYSVTYRSLLLVLELLLSIAFVFLAIKYLGRKVEFLFLALAITLGSYLSFALPPVTNLAPDDQIHYERALGLSFLGHGEVGALEGELVDVPWGRGGGLNHERIDEFCKRMEEVGSDSNATDNGRESIGFVVPVSGESYLFVPIVGAIPSALGLWMGRLLHLSFVGTFILGRWFNLLFYVLVVFGAIGITPVKKVLFAVVGAAPNSPFLGFRLLLRSLVACSEHAGAGVVRETLLRFAGRFGNGRFARSLSYCFYVGDHGQGSLLSAHRPFVPDSRETVCES